jgi:hypothetical protein
MAALFTAAAPHFYITTPSNYTPTSYQGYVQQLASSVGAANTLGYEMDNEPDAYVSNGYRPANWTFADYLRETAGYQQTFASYVNSPGVIATASAGEGWDINIPALLAQESGQISAYTAHRYGTTACNNTPTVTNLLTDPEAHRYYARYAPLVETMGSIPVRIGEMNSVACSGYAGVSNAFAASLWMVDSLFEGKSAGVAGVNIHSGGTLAGALPYDIAYLNSSGSTTVYAPYYGLLFFAQAIQNGAQPVPVTITKSTGNVKIWATIDSSNVVRVVVLEKDTDGISNSRTVALTLGPSYTAAGTLTTMTASTVSATSGITIAGQTFDGTTNGLIRNSATSSSVTPVGGVYTITVQDGTAALLTIP